MIEKEPKINEEKIAFQNAVYNNRKTLEDYAVNKLESYERTIAQQNALIGILEKDIKKYEAFVELLRKHGTLTRLNNIDISCYNEEDSKAINKVLKLKGDNNG